MMKKGGRNTWCGRSREKDTGGEREKRSKMRRRGERKGEKRKGEGRA